jgi:hypothetical protein
VEPLQTDLRSGGHPAPEARGSQVHPPPPQAALATGIATRDNREHGLQRSRSRSSSLLCDSRGRRTVRRLRGLDRSAPSLLAARRKANTTDPPDMARRNRPLTQAAAHSDMQLRGLRVAAPSREQGARRRLSLARRAGWSLSHAAGSAERLPERGCAQGRRDRQAERAAAASRLPASSRSVARPVRGAASQARCPCLRPSPTDAGEPVVLVGAAALTPPGAQGAEPRNDHCEPARRAQASRRGGRRTGLTRREQGLSIGPLRTLPCRR